MNNEISVPTIQTREELLRLKTQLNRLSDISYTFSNFNKQYPIASLSESQAREIIGVYMKLMQDAAEVVSQSQDHLKGAKDGVV